LRVVLAGLDELASRRFARLVGQEALGCAHRTLAHRRWVSELLGDLVYQSLEQHRRIAEVAIDWFASVMAPTERGLLEADQCRRTGGPEAGRVMRVVEGDRDAMTIELGDDVADRQPVGCGPWGTGRTGEAATPSARP
jgi:hypothetical protein